MRVLLLNQSEEVLDVIGWQRAATMYFQGKVHAPYNHDEAHEIKTVGGVFKLPTVLVLAEYVHIPYKRAAVNKVNVLKRDGYTCQYCGCKLTAGLKQVGRDVFPGTIDHVMPSSRGGKHEWKNVAAACVHCNNKKDNKTPQEAGMRLKKVPAAPTRTFILLTVSDLQRCQTWKRWVEV